MKVRELGTVSLLMLLLSIGYSLTQYTPIEKQENTWTTYGIPYQEPLEKRYIAIETAVSVFNEQLQEVENIKIVNIEVWQWERPRGSGNYPKLWSVDMYGEGYAEDGTQMWIRLIVSYDPETGDIGKGPIIGGSIE